MDRALPLLVLAAITLATSSVRAQVGVYAPEGAPAPETGRRPLEDRPTDELRATLASSSLEIGMGGLTVAAGVGLLVGSAITGALSEDREPPGRFSILGFGRLNGHDDGLLAASITLASASLVTMLVGAFALLVPARERRRGVRRELHTRALPELVMITLDERSASATLRIDW